MKTEQNDAAERLRIAREKRRAEYGNGQHTPGDGKVAFPILSFHEFGRAAGPRYIVKGIVPYGGLVVVWGPPKCGKSFWTTDLALHVALGRKYRGHRVRQGLVVYLALEGEHGFKARRDAFARRFLEPDDDPPFWIMTTQIDLRRHASTLVKDIKLQLGDDRPALIVIDTLNRSLFGSESKDEDMAGYIRAADFVRAAFDCAVLIVHHCGVSGDRPRGHTSLTGAVDAQLSVKRDESGTIVVTVEYMKDGNSGEIINSRLEVVELDADEDGDPVTSCVIISVDGPTTRQTQQPKLPKSARLALRALHETIIDQGHIPPANSHIPDNTRVVTLDQWETTAHLRGLSKSDIGDSRRKAFVRAGDTLLERGFIGVWQPFVWLAKDPPK